MPTLQSAALARLYDRFRAANRVGLLIHEDYFLHILQRRLNEMPASGVRLPLPGFPELDLAITRVAAGQSGITPAIRFRIANFVAETQLRPRKAGLPVLSTFTFAFDEVFLDIEPDPSAVETLRLHAPRSLNSANRRVAVATGTPDEREETYTDLGWDDDRVAAFEEFERQVAVLGFDAALENLGLMLGNLRIREWCDSVKMSGSYQIEYHDDPALGRGVILTPLHAELLAPAACPCAEPAADVTVVNASADPLNPQLEIHIQPRANTPGRAKAAPHPGSGVAGLQQWAYVYLPRVELEKAFGPGALPGFGIQAPPAGIGPARANWAAYGVFEGMKLTIETANPSLALDTSMLLDFYARAWLNLPCDSEQEIARAHVDGRIEDIRIRLDLIVDTTTAAVVFDANLEHHNTQPLNARFQAAAVGIVWPITVVFEALLRHIIPGLLSQQLREQIDKLRFQLFSIKPASPPVTAHFHHFRNDGVLVGLADWREG